MLHTILFAACTILLSTSVYSAEEALLVAEQQKKVDEFCKRLQKNAAQVYQGPQLSEQEMKERNADLIVMAQRLETGLCEVFMDPKLDGDLITGYVGTGADIAFTNWRGETYLHRVLDMYGTYTKDSEEMAVAVAKIRRAVKVGFSLDVRPVYGPMKGKTVSECLLEQALNKENTQHKREACTHLLTSLLKEVNSIPRVDAD